VKIGDSTLISFKFKNSIIYILIDAGNDKNFVKEKLIQMEINHIDILLITHNDKDHCNGVIGILDAKIKN